MPGAARTIEGEGWDHVAWRVERPDGSWIAKEVKDGPAHERSSSVRREVAVMQFVRRSLGGWAAADATVLDGGRLTYRRVAGAALQELLRRDQVPATAVRQLAGTVGRLIADLAALDPTGAGVELPVEDGGWEPWYDGLPARIGTIAPVVGADGLAAVERFAGAARPPAPDTTELVFTHFDLGAEHVLVDPATLAIAGVIDWTDAAVADPAADAGRLLRDLGAGMLPHVLDGMGLTGGQRRAVESRAWCYARLLIVEDLAYTIERRPDLVEIESANLHRLFAGVA